MSKDIHIPNVDFGNMASISWMNLRTWADWINWFQIKTSFYLEDYLVTPIILIDLICSGIWESLLAFTMFTLSWAAGGRDTKFKIFVNYSRIFLVATPSPFFSFSVLFSFLFATISPSLCWQCTSFLQIGIDACFFALKCCWMQTSVEFH